MVSGIVQTCGAFGGAICGPTPANVRGQFENTFIRNRAVKPYLVRIGADPLGQTPLPDQSRLVPFPELREIVEGIMSFQGLQPGIRWYYKEPKMSLVWKVWNDAFPNAQWVIARRDTDDIIKSCLRTSFMHKRHTEDEWREWVQYHLDRFEEMKAAMPGRVVEVWPSKFINGDPREIQSVIEWMGLHWDPNAIIEFVSPDLWHFDNKPFLEENSNGDQGIR